MMYGFAFIAPNFKDYFFVTTQTKRTQKLCERVEQELIKDGYKRVYNGKYHGVFGDFSIRDKLKAGTCEVKQLSSGRKYYSINGEGWGGLGSFVDDGKQ